MVNEQLIDQARLLLGIEFVDRRSLERFGVETRLAFAAPWALNME